MGTASAGLGILVTLHRQHPVGHRQAVVQLGTHQGFGTAVGHVLVMTGIATHHATQRNHRRMLAGGGNRFGSQRHFPGAGHAHHVDHGRIDGQCAGIMPLDNGFRLAGPAFTIKYVPADEFGRSVGDFVDDIPAGAVPVIDNGARVDVTVWGDLMTTIASQRQLAGTVIDGVCRDLDRALEEDYPLFTRAHWMRTGKDRVQVEATGVPVTIGQVRVAPGDLIKGDADGVIQFIDHDRPP